MNKLRELFELHEKFNKHEFKEGIICECGLLHNENIAFIEEKVFESKLDELFKKDIKAIKYISKINLSKLNYFNKEALEVLCKYLAKFGIEKFEWDEVMKIAKNVKLDIICEHGDLDFILDLSSEYNISYFKGIIQMELAKKGNEGNILKYIKRFAVDNQDLLFKIPYKYYPLIKLSPKVSCGGIIDKHIDIEDFIKKLDFIFQKNPKYELDIEVPKSIFDKLIKKRRLDLAYKISPILTALYISQPGFFSQDELKNIKDVLINKYKIFKEVREMNKAMKRYYRYEIIKIEDKIYIAK